MPKKFETIVVELFPSWLNILFSSEKTHGCSLQIAFKFLINHCWTVSFWSHVMIKWTGWMDVVHISLNLPRRGCPWVFAWRRTFSLNALKKMQGSLSSIQGLTVRRVCCWNACVQTSVVGRVFFRHFSKYEFDLWTKRASSKRLFSALKQLVSHGMNYLAVKLVPAWPVGFSREWEMVQCLR